MTTKKNIVCMFVCVVFLYRQNTSYRQRFPQRHTVRRNTVQSTHIDTMHKHRQHRYTHPTETLDFSVSGVTSCDTPVVNESLFHEIQARGISLPACCLCALHIFVRGDIMNLTGFILSG